MPAIERDGGRVKVNRLKSHRCRMARQVNIDTHIANQRTVHMHVHELWQLWIASYRRARRCVRRGGARERRVSRSGRHHLGSRRDCAGKIVAARRGGVDWCLSKNRCEADDQGKYFQNLQLTTVSRIQTILRTSSLRALNINTNSSVLCCSETKQSCVEMHCTVYLPQWPVSALVLVVTCWTHAVASQPDRPRETRDCPVWARHLIISMVIVINIKAEAQQYLMRRKTAY